MLTKFGTLAVVAVCALIALPTPGTAQNSHTEDFTTTAFKDTVNTTADWNTTDGELKLFPLVPTLAGSYDTPGDALSVAVAGDLAFIADFNSGLQIMDISNPAAPLLIGNFITPGQAWDVAVAGDLAFVADGPAGLTIVDITDPAAPSLVASYPTPGYARGVAVAGDLAFVADEASGLQIIDISNPAAPSLVGNFDTGVAVGVTVAGDLAFVADSTSGLQIVDITNPAAPSLVGTYDTPGSAIGVAVAGDLAFVADQTSGLQIVDISNPAAPSLIGSYDTPGNAQGVVVAGDRAFVADNTSGLQIVDISNPAAPSAVAGYDTPGSARGVAVAGDRAFVADEASGLQIVTISDPTVPSLIGSYDTPVSALGVAVDGDLAFVADYTSGLQIVDISNPAAASLVASYATPGSARGVAVDGDHAFVANEAFGLEIVDISNPAAPFLVGSYDTPGSAIGVAVAGDLAFVADNTSGLQIVDISDPAAPSLVGSYDTPVKAWGGTVAGDRAFVADQSSGLQIIQFAQDDYDPSSLNTGQSLAVDSEDHTILRARLETTQAAGVTWELSADAGAFFQPFAADGGWAQFSNPGTDLLWRSTHTAASSANPAVSDLTLEWLNKHGHIQSVADIANDQGRQVSLEWQRSGYDFLGDPQQIVEYAVYRQIDPALKAADMATLPSDASTALQAHASSAKAAGWHFITTVPVRAQDDYAVVVPTLADSTVAGGLSLSTFMVSALTATPGVFFDSPEASGYSVDNLAPGVPTALLAAYAPSEVVLDWNDSEDADFHYFRIYRDTSPGFEPSTGNLVQETAASAWTDPTGDPWGFYYKVTTLDHAGNESEAAEPQSVSGVAGDAVPVRTALLAAYPNPFNPSTKLSFELAAPAHARLKIFDTAGRLVMTLVDEQRASGRHEIVWNGQNSAGQSVASGVYLYRFEAGEVVQTKRMMLVK